MSYNRRTPSTNENDRESIRSSGSLGRQSQDNDSIRSYVGPDSSQRRILNHSGVAFQQLRSLNPEQPSGSKQKEKQAQSPVKKIQG